MAFQGDSIFWVEVEKIVPNPFQPRREFDQQKLVELSESVRMYGILQPLTVTRKEIQREDGTFYTEYELIAGERRLRASKLAGLSQVPVIIREGEDSEQEKLELAIIENLQREDLNAVDRALAFKQLAEVFGLSHTLVAKKVGRSREYVSNSIRLLGLPEHMLNSLRMAEMTEGHARTLLMLNDKPEEQDVVFREILLKKLSVRELERIVRKIATDKVRKKNLTDIDVELIEMEKKFMETLGTRVQIQKTEYGGQLTIDYFSVDDLEMMLKRIKDESGINLSFAPVAAASADKLTEHTPISVMVDGGETELSDQGDEVVLAEDDSVASDYVDEDVAKPEESLPGSPATEVEETNPQTETVTENNQNNNPPVEVPNEVEEPKRISYPEFTVRAEVTTVLEAPTAPEIKESEVAQAAAEEPTAITQPEPVKEYEETVTIPPPDKDDESGLYSIRNFSV